MNIVSKFNDYYDIGSSMGIDESIVYVRNKEVVATENKMDISDILRLIGYPFTSRWRFGPWGIYGRLGASTIVVGFCGKLYPVVVLSNGKTDQKNPFNTYTFFYKWDDSIEKMVTKINYGRKYNNIIETFKKYLNLEPVENVDLFHTYKTPIFLIPDTDLKVMDMWGLELKVPARDYSVNHVVQNPCLADIQFYKAVDAYTAYQEIMMFITGVMSTNKVPPVEISDTDMRDAKGFNDKSFKKEPTKHFRK